MPNLGYIRSTADILKFGAIWASERRCGMSELKLGKIKTREKFPSMDKLLESSDMPDLYNLEEYLVRTGIFDQIKNDIKVDELKRMDLTQIEREERSQHDKLMKRWYGVLKELNNKKLGFPMEYAWMDFDLQVKHSTEQFKKHDTEFYARKTQAKSRWESFIEKLGKIYKTKIIDTYYIEQSFDTYFIHVPKVQGSRCECTDSMSSGKEASFSVEFFGLGGGGVTEMSCEEGLVITVENGECCKIEITVLFSIQKYELYRMGTLKKKGTWPKPERMTAIAPVTINPNEDTCGYSLKNISKPQKIDTSRFSAPPLKKTLKVGKKLQTDKKISLGLPTVGITTEVGYTFTNISEKHFSYTLPGGHVYTYYNVPNTIGYSWTLSG